MRTKSGDKRQCILEAATRIFAREGFDGAKVSSIATEAGVATGSVYLYFQGKEDILDSLFHNFWDALQKAMQNIAHIGPMERIRDQLALFFDHLSQDRALACVYLRDHHRFTDRKPVGIEAYESCLSMGVEAYRRATSNPPDPSRFALSLGILFGGVRASLEYWLNHDDLPLETIREHMLTMAMAGVSALAKEKK